MIMTATTPSPEWLTQTTQGTYRIADTRVSIDSVIIAFWQGATPEEIVQSYPALSLAQVYSCIGYYLSNQQIIDAYLKEQKQSAQEWKKTLGEQQKVELSALRERLLVHREVQKETA